MSEKAKRLSQSFSEEDVDVLADIMDLLNAGQHVDQRRYREITSRPAFASVANRIVRMRAKMK